MPRIKCMVGECMYQEGGECKASGIHIRPAVQGFMISAADDTACETFRARYR